MKRLPIKIRRRKDGTDEIFYKNPKAGDSFTFTLEMNGDRMRIKNFVREKSTNQTKT